MTLDDENIVELKQFLQETYPNKFNIKDMFLEPGQGEDVISIILNNDSNTSFKIWGGGTSFGYEVSPSEAQSNIMVDWTTCFRKFKEWAEVV